MNSYDEPDINLGSTQGGPLRNTQSYVVSRRIIGPLERPALIAKMIKFGITKNESQAIKVLVGITITCTLLAIGLFIYFLGFSDKTLPIKYQIPEALKDQMQYGSQLNS